MPLLLVPPLLLVLVRRREAAKPGELQQQAASIMARVVIRRMSQAQRPRAWLLSTRRDGAASDRRLLRSEANRTNLRRSRKPPRNDQMNNDLAHVAGRNATAPFRLGMQSRGRGE